MPFSLYNHSFLWYDCKLLVVVHHVFTHFSFSASLPWMLRVNRNKPVSNMLPASSVRTCIALSVFSLHYLPDAAPIAATPRLFCHIVRQIRLCCTSVTPLIGSCVISPNAVPCAFLLQQRCRIGCTLSHVAAKSHSQSSADLLVSWLFKKKIICLLMANQFKIGKKYPKNIKKILYHCST